MYSLYLYKPRDCICVFLYFREKHLHSKMTLVWTFLCCFVLYITLISPVTQGNNTMSATVTVTSTLEKYRSV